MLTLSNKPLAGSPAPQSGRKTLTAFVLQSILLAGCASSAIERSPVASDDASRRRSDTVACTRSDEPVSGWLAQSMLMGLTVGGGPAVIESGNAAKRRAFKKCMDARQAKPIL
jgi:hypothetical protein